MPNLDQLRQASFRNIPFAVEAIGGEHGRRLKVHEYPDRDIPWPEDLGRRARAMRVRGFLLENAVYGGGDVGQQLGQMIGASETKGPGPLIHPILGQLNVNCRGFTHDAALDGASLIEIAFDFVESGVRRFPTVNASTGAAVATAATGAQTTASAAFTTFAATALPYGASIVQAASGVAGPWGIKAVGFGADATSLLNMASRLAGSFGRYAGGANVSGLALVSGLLSSAGLGSGAALGLQVSDLQQLIVRATGLRSRIAVSVEALVSAFAGLSIGTAPSVAASVYAVPAAVAGAAQNPADALRLLGQLAVVDVTPALGSSGVARAMIAMQGATVDLFRRSAVIALAQASTAYQPSSRDDAAAVMQQVAGALDSEMGIAGDQGADDVYQALWTLRTAVVDDLTTRGADLAPMAEFVFTANLPAVVLAQRLYLDPAREAELIAEANPVHPLFMPDTFQALAS